jgi:hypothetical protein
LALLHLNEAGFVHLLRLDVDLEEHLMSLGKLMDVVLEEHLLQAGLVHLIDVVIEELLPLGGLIYQKLWSSGRTHFARTKIYQSGQESRQIA